ncbi:hypothetical protein R3P38DRAFT_3175757 [Favolaschia claudopus]|uniref:Uncharacterized protein n=1 Tax=Favolaschia claudopus TaxID=2862362 RepID=A0AAW0D5Z3_9AGAR
MKTPPETGVRAVESHTRVQGPPSRPSRIRATKRTLQTEPASDKTTAESRRVVEYPRQPHPLEPNPAQSTTGT